MVLKSVSRPGKYAPSGQPNTRSRLRNQSPLALVVDAIAPDAANGTFRVAGAAAAGATAGVGGVRRAARRANLVDHLGASAAVRAADDCPPVGAAAATAATVAAAGGALKFPAPEKMAKSVSSTRVS